MFAELLAAAARAARLGGARYHAHQQAEFLLAVAAAVLIDWHGLLGHQNGNRGLPGRTGLPTPPPPSPPAVASSPLTVDLHAAPPRPWARSRWSFPDPFAGQGHGARLLDTGRRQQEGRGPLAVGGAVTASPASRV